MKARMCAVAAAAVLGVGVTPAGAETCGLVTDAANDTIYADRGETEGVLVQEDVDIASADVATDGERLYAAIRVQSMRGLMWTGGATYRLEFTANGRKLFVQAAQGGAMLGTRHGDYGFTAGRVGIRAYRVRGAFDWEGNEIRVQAPLRTFGRGSVQPGDELSGFKVTAVTAYTDFGQVAPGVSSRVTVSDSATGSGTYVAGDESCIEPVADHDPDAYPRG